MSAIYRFGDSHPDLLAGLGLRRSPWVPTLSRPLRMVKVAGVRQAMLSFMVALSESRGARLTVASVNGKTMRGVWEDGEQLRLPVHHLPNLLPDFERALIVRAGTRFQSAPQLQLRHRAGCRSH